MDSDDGQLMRQVQAGELRSFDLLVERYRSALLRVAAGMLGDAALAEDVVQETFLAVFAARHTYNPAFQFRTWLWTILLNFCRRHAARQSRPLELAKSAALAAGAHTSPGSAGRTRETPLGALLERERSEQVERLLSELPDVQADAIRLRFFAGLTYQEIAQSMGVSLGGAKLRVRAGLARLSQQLCGDKESFHEL